MHNMGSVHTYLKILANKTEKSEDVQLNLLSYVFMVNTHKWSHKWFKLADSSYDQEGLL